MVDHLASPLGKDANPILALADAIQPRVAKEYSAYIAAYTEQDAFRRAQLVKHSNETIPLKQGEALAKEYKEKGSAFNPSPVTIKTSSGNEVTFSSDDIKKAAIVYDNGDKAYQALKTAATKAAKEINPASMVVGNDSNAVGVLAVDTIIDRAEVAGDKIGKQAGGNAPMVAPPAQSEVRKR